MRVYAIILALFLLAACAGVMKTPRMDTELYGPIPEEHIQYTHYRTAVGTKPSHSDFAVVEATVLGLEEHKICPYRVEDCPITPYIFHTGHVRVDKIMSYEEYDFLTEEEVEELRQEQDEPMPEPTPTSQPGSRGSYVPEPDEPPEVEPLIEGQEVVAQFLLSAKPARMKRITLYKRPTAQESMILQTVYTPSEDGRRVDYKPIPVEDGFLVLYSEFRIEQTDTEPLPEREVTLIKELPGLEAGDKFKAEIAYNRYNGKIFIEEYEVIR